MWFTGSMILDGPTLTGLSLVVVALGGAVMQVLTFIRAGRIETKTDGNFSAMRTELAESRQANTNLNTAAVDQAEATRVTTLEATGAAIEQAKATPPPTEPPSPPASPLRRPRRPS